MAISEEMRTGEISEAKPDKVELLKFAKARLMSAKKWKFLYAGDGHKYWIDNIKFYKGFQWQYWRRNDNKKSSIVINKIFSSIQKEVPFMTDSSPKIYVQPTEPSDGKIAKILESIIETQWLSRDMHQKLPECVINAKQCGTGFFMPFWNPNLADGQGDVDCAVVDPINVFPFSGTERLEDAEGIIHAEHVSVGFIRRMWPNESKRMRGAKTDHEIPNRGEATQEVSASHVRQISDTTAARTDYVFSDDSTALTDENFKESLLVRLWFRDTELEEYEFEGDAQDDNGNLIFGEDGEKQKEKLTGERPKYPNGRLVTMAGGVILEDKPYEWEFPMFSSVKNYINPNEFWGMSDVDQVKDMQKELNKLHSTVIDIFREMAHPTVILAVGSGIPADNFVKSANAVYESNLPNPAQVLEPGQPPASIFGFIEQLSAQIDTTAGIADVSASRASELPSGRSLQEFQEITQTRLRQKIRNMEAGVQGVARAWLEMILKNYTGERVMRIINPNKQGNDFIFVFKEEDPNLAAQIKQQAAAQMQPGSEQMDTTGQPIPGSGIPVYTEVINLAEVKGHFDLTVATGSTISTSKLAKFDQALALFAQGVIDQKALLEAADYPNRDEIMDRMAQAAQAAQQAQMQQAQLAAQPQQEMPPQQMPPVPPKVSLSLKGQDLINPVAQQAVMAGLTGGNGNAIG